MQNNPKGISGWDLPVTDAMYTFVDHAGQPTHIAASALLRSIQRVGVIPTLCEMGQSLIDAIESGNLNQEEEYALKLPDEALEVPAIVGQWGDEHIIIDGTHRVWRRYMRGDRDFPAYYIPEAAWRHFVIYDVPDELVEPGKWAEYLKNSKVR